MLGGKSYLLIKYVGSCCNRCVLVVKIFSKFVGSCCYRCVLDGKSYLLIKFFGGCCYRCVGWKGLSSHKVGL